MEYEELLRKYTSEFDFLADIPRKDKNKYPPWAIRKYIEMSNALLHPDLSKELRILSYCTIDSVFLARKLLQSYFSWSYNLTTETSYSLVMFFAGEDFSILSPFSQIDGISFQADRFDGPTSNPEVLDNDAISDVFRSEIESEYKSVNIRLGNSVHKSDIVWFIKKYWKDIEPLMNRLEIDNQQIRPRNEARRNITEYAMRNRKISTIERNGAHRTSGRPVPDYDTLNAGYKQVKPNAKKNASDLFSIVHEQLSHSLTHHLGNNTYVLCIDEIGQTPYLYLEHK